MKTIAHIETQSGITLIEVIIGVILSLVLSIALVQIFLSNKVSYKTQTAISRVQENARFAMHQISQSINAGGFTGCLPGRLLSDAASVPPVVDNAGGYSAISGTSAFGISRAVPLPAVLNRSMISESDDIGVNNITGLWDGMPALISDCDKATLFTITTVNDTASGSPPSFAIEHDDPLENPLDPSSKAIYGNELKSMARIYRWATSFIYIDTSMAGKNASINRPCKITDDSSTAYDDRKYCALYLNGNELMEGVHGMNVSYGVDTDEDLLAEKYVSNIGGNNVMSIRVTLSINSVDPLPDTGLLVKQVSSTFNLRNNTLN